MAKSWDIDPSQFAGMVEEDVGKRQRVVAMALLSEVVRRSPVGNPELWAINETAVQYNKAVNNWNSSLYDDAANLTKTGRLKKGLKVNDGMDVKKPKGYVGGTFRASHLVSIGTPDYSEPDGPDKEGSATINAGNGVIATAPAYSVIYIQSNLPYSVPLEQGHSKQAPAGVYAVSFHGVSQAYK